MAVHRLQMPDGKIVRIEAPADTPQQQLMQTAAENYKPANRTSAAGAFMRSLANGASFNFADELGAAGDAVIPDAALGGASHNMYQDGGFSKAYQANKKQYDDMDNIVKVEHPVASGIGNVVGAIAGTLAGMRGAGMVGAGFAKVAPAAAKAIQGVQAAAQGTKIGAGVARAAGSAVGQSAIGGGVQGAISGAGAGDTAESRRKGAASGALIGSTIGAVTGGTVAGLAPVVKKYVNAFAGKNITQQALSQISKSLARDGYDVTSPAGVRALKTEVGRFAGKPVSLADIGSATRARTGVGLRTPSKVQQTSIDAVTDRSAGAADRLHSDIQTNVGPTNFHQLDDALVQQQEQLALPLKTQALQNGPNVPRIAAPALPDGTAPVALPSQVPNGAVVPSDTTLQNLARLPSAQNALSGARNMAAAERDLLNAQGMDTSHLPDFPDQGAPMDMKSLDYLKRHLDTEVNNAYKSGDSAARAAAPGLRNLRDAIRDRMRVAVPEYGEYLDNYSGPQDLLDALQQGRGGNAGSARGSDVGFNRLDPEQITAQQAARSPAEQEFYRVGAARNMADRVNDVNDTGVAQPANRILQNPTERARVAALGLPDDNVQALTEAVGQERQLARLPQELQGSGTDARLAARQDSDQGITGNIPINPANPASYLGLLARKATGAVSLARNTKINEEALPRLLQQDPAQINDVIDELTQAGKLEDAATLARVAKAKLGSKVMGNVIGGAVAMPQASTPISQFGLQSDGTYVYTDAQGNLKRTAPFTQDLPK